MDISANQGGGLSAACFFEEVDRLVGKNHLFKRATLLIKVRPASSVRYGLLRWW